MTGLVNWKNWPPAVFRTSAPFPPAAPGDCLLRNCQGNFAATFAGCSLPDSRRRESGRLLFAGSQCASVFALLALLSGCMQSRVEESRELHTRIQKDEAVVILAKPQVEGASAEDDFMHCVSSELAGHGDGAIATRSDEQFTDALFPWFEPGTAPSKPEAVATLLTRPGVAEKVAASGVRYIVWLDGGTQKTDGGGSLACGAAPGGAGCIGFGWWEKESNYEATIWDLKQAKAAGSVGTNVTGTSAIIGAVVPLPFIARVQGTACNRMANQLRTFFTGSDDTEPTQAAVAQIKSARK